METLDIKFESKFYTKQESQIKIVNKRFDMGQSKDQHNDEYSIAGNFYWGDQKLLTCGIASGITEREQSFPLLPQLLLTPKLIVDILPLPESEYIYRYGVSFKQLLSLTEEGFIIPNIYYYYNEGWKEYAHIKKLWPILFHKASRINAEWISGYLDKRHRFSSHKKSLQIFFESELNKISNSEQKRILRATDGAVDKIVRIPEVFGHRMAYLVTLGKSNPRMQSVVDRIQELWKSRGSRHKAIKLIQAAQGLTIGALTAAYGGKSYITNLQYERLHEYVSRIVPISPSTTTIDLLNDLERRNDLKEQAEFCLNIANELAGLNLTRFSEGENTIPLLEAFPLDDQQFEEYVKVLKNQSIQSAALSVLVEEIRTDLVNESKSPDVKEYLETIHELESLLKPLPMVPAFLNKLSDISYFLSETFTPSSSQPQAPETFHISLLLHFLFTQASGGIKCMANTIDGHEYKSLFASSRNKVLCEQWRNIKKNIKQMRKNP